MNDMAQVAKLYMYIGTKGGLAQKRQTDGLQGIASVTNHEPTAGSQSVCQITETQMCPLHSNTVLKRKLLHKTELRLGKINM